MPAILTSFPDARLLLVGHDAGTLDAVKAYASEIGVESHVEFITDTLHPEPFIAKSRIGILSTNETVHGEGTANALLEYMALSKPVVVSDNGGNREVVKDGQSGFVVKPGSPDEIAKHVNLLLGDSVLAQEVGRMGKAILIEKFDMDKMVNAYVDIYQTLKSQDSE
jgi:glycosyltransferase involved in cell wall biosynthesis